MKLIHLSTWLKQIGVSLKQLKICEQKHQEFVSYIYWMNYVCKRTGIHFFLLICNWKLVKLEISSLKTFAILNFFDVVKKSYKNRILPKNKHSNKLIFIHPLETEGLIWYYNLRKMIISLCVFVPKSLPNRWESSYLYWERLPPTPKEKSP